MLRAKKLGGEEVCLRSQPKLRGATSTIQKAVAEHILAHLRVRGQQQVSLERTDDGSQPL